jgi:hypothetical protein
VNSFDHFRYIVDHEADLLVSRASQTGERFVRKALADTIEQLNARLRKLGGIPVEPTRAGETRRAFTIVTLQRNTPTQFGTPDSGVAKQEPKLAIAFDEDAYSAGALDELVCTVAAALNLNPERVMHTTREKRYSYARQMCMHQAYFVYGLSSTRIARYFGKRDHTTALYGRDRIQADLDTGKLDETVWNELTERVRAIGRKHGLVHSSARKDEPEQLALPA